RIVESHRDVWAPFLSNPALKDVLKDDPTFLQRPITNDERFFVTRVIFHVEGVFKAATDRYYSISSAEEKDIGEFLDLPIPKKVWLEIVVYQPEAFVRFIEGLLGKHRRGVMIVSPP